MCHTAKAKDALPVISVGLVANTSNRNVLKIKRDISLHFKSLKEVENFMNNPLEAR